MINMIRRKAGQGALEAGSIPGYWKCPDLLVYSKGIPILILAAVCRQQRDSLTMLGVHLVEQFDWEC
jgi:hypothetical protein